MASSRVDNYVVVAREGWTLADEKVGAAVLCCMHGCEQQDGLKGVTAFRVVVQHCL